jgi:hypothetical protein
MRDNLILNAGKYDNDDLCYDICGGLYGGFDDVEQRGLMVWAEPWMSRSWEVSEEFVRKWGFLLKGCTKLIESTNHWRAKRGEQRLVVEV